MSRSGRLLLRSLAVGYVALLVALPVAIVFWRVVGAGLDTVWAVLTRPGLLDALWLTLRIALIAIPANTIFGVACALLLVRHRFPAQGLLNGIIDLPFAVSPVVVGLGLVLVYGQRGWLGAWLAEQDLQVIYAAPGMILATIFISLPFVVREVVPVLRELGTEQEEASATLGAGGWQTFWRVTLPSIRWGVAYGVVLTTARVLGEFGAVSVVSGRLIGRTSTLTVYVEERFQAFDLTGAYVASVLLAMLAMATLFAMNLAAREESR